MAISYATAQAAPMLESEQERVLIQRWQSDGDRDSLEALILSHARQVHACARKLNFDPDHQEELVAEGVVGLIRAADRFDQSRGVRFSTYAHWWVQNSIRSAQSRLLSVVDAPAQAQAVENGFDHLLTQISAEEANLDEQVVSPDPTPEEQVMTRCFGQHLRGKLVEALCELSEQERTVVLARYMNTVAEPIDSLADRLSLSRDRLRQLERRGMARLKYALLSRGVSGAQATGAIQ